MKNYYKKSCPPSLRSGVSGRGITVIEILVVLAVLGILMSVTLPQFSKTRENQVFKNGVQDILSSIEKARSQTLASLNSLQYGVHFETEKIVIFQGTSFTEGTAGNEIINIITPASISDVSLGAGSPTSGNVYFNRLSGSPSTTGTVTISSTNFSKMITISATGVASVD